MKVLCFVMAEAASVDETGRLSIIGTFERVGRARRLDAPRNAEGPFPWQHPSVLVAYLEWRAVEDGYDLTHTFRFLNEESALLGETEPRLVHGAPTLSGRPIRRAIIAAAGGISFPRPGDYTIQLVVNGKVAADLEVYADVEVVPPVSDDADS